VVDDEPAIRDSIAMLLSSAGIGARVYASAAAFLDEPRSRGEAGVLLGDCWPRHGALRVLSEIRRRHPGLPVILLTSDDELISMVGAAPDLPPVLRKPFDAEDLLAYVGDMRGCDGA